MIPDASPSKDTIENDVRYGIAECRKRIRSRRATLQTKHRPIDVLSGDATVVAANPVESYAEILATVSLSQGSISRLVECLLGPAEVSSGLGEEHEEAAIT
ncbi:MAG: hypothetical protein ABR555_03255 [Pyrinomonadaceae bacterium]